MRPRDSRPRSTAAFQLGLTAGSVTDEASAGRGSTVCISLLCYQKSDRIKVKMKKVTQHDTAIWLRVCALTVSISIPDVGD